MIKNLSFLSIFFMSFGLWAGLYDPYFLEYSCNYHYEKCQLSYGKNILFYFDTCIEKDVDNVITNAVKKDARVYIHEKAIETKKIVFDSRRFIKGKMPFLPCNSFQSNMRVYHKNLTYDSQEVAVKDIKSSFYLRIQIKVKEELKTYWLTFAQRSHLTSLIKNGAKKIKFNLQAIDDNLPYRDKMPVDKAIEQLDDIN